MPVLSSKERDVHTAVKRCAGCGQRLSDPPPPSCPLCGFYFGEERITGADVTPYAQAYARGERGWRHMTEWVWFAGAERLKHIALMHSSAASSRFAAGHLFLLVITLGLLQASFVGFLWLPATTELRSDDSTSAKRGAWIQVASAPRDASTNPSREARVELWWSPTRALIALASGLGSAWILTYLTLGVIRWGMTKAHEEKYRSEQRMTAALQYSTAWALPIVVALLIAVLLPVSHIGDIKRWSWYPSNDTVVLSAAVVGAFGLAMWWFWLMRLGFTAPPSTRTRVSAFFSIAVPVFVGAIAAGWWFGLNLLHNWLFQILPV